MECDDVRLLQDWVLHWPVLGEFEIVPVGTGRDTAEHMEARL